MEDCQSYIGKNITELPTPAFLIHKRKVEQNCGKMLEKCKSLGIALRAQTKTHKTIEGAIIQTGGTKRRLVVSTLQEAWFYFSHGFEDILYGYPLALHHLPKCSKLVSRMNSFHIIVNSEFAANLLLKNPPPPKKKWSVYVKIDAGYARAGIPWQETEKIIRVVQILQHPDIQFRGLYCHCGDSYTTSHSGVSTTRDNSVTRLLGIQVAIQKAGLPCVELGIGSTPSCSLDTQQDMSQLTEVHPGNYIFYDAQQASYGSCRKEEIAVRVMARVLSHHQDRNQILIDLGFMGFTRQGLDQLDIPGYGSVLEPNLKLVSMTQEIGKVETVDGTELDFEKYPIGKEIFLHPYHACATSAMYPHYFVHDDDNTVTDVWVPTRGW